MFSAIGARTQPKGQFGNRLLTYLNLRLLSRQLRTSFFNVNRVDRSYVHGIHRPLRLPRLLGAPEYVSMAQLHSADFLGWAEERLRGGRTLYLKPKLYLESLARFDFESPRGLAALRFALCSTHRHSSSNHAPIVMHLRGTDFDGWKPGAVLPESYYRDGLDFVDSAGWDSRRVRICTDDPSHPARQGLERDLRIAGRLVESYDCKSPFECDFAAMLEASVIVSSPSSFAVCAGILVGAPVVHSKSRVESRVKAGELFWTKVRNNELKGYEVLAQV